MSTQAVMPPESTAVAESVGGVALHRLVGPNGFRKTVKTKPDPYKALDGKHYWNCWTSNYQPDRDGYCQHAFCEEDRTGRALCGVTTQEGGGISFPNELDVPSCLKCRRIMAKRGALRPNVQAQPQPTGGSGGAERKP